MLVLLSFSIHAVELGTIEVKAKKEVSQFTFSQGYTLNPSETPLSPLSFLLNDVPGAIANQSGGPGSQISFSIRGTETGHTLWSLDGLKLNDSSNTDRSFDASFLSSGFIEKIEIQKGPQAVLFGSDALGGVVEMTTRKGSVKPQSRFKVASGSFGTIDTAISHDWNSKNSQGTLYTGLFHTDGISRLNKKRYEAKEADSSDMLQFTSSSKHYWNLKAESDLLFGFIRGQNELDTSTKDSIDDKSQNNQYFLQQKTSQEINKSLSISFRNGMNRHQRAVDSSLGYDSAYDGNNLQHELLMRKNYFSTEWLVGVSAEHQDFVGKNVRKNVDLSSIFIQSSYTRSLFKIHGGLRSDYHSRYHHFNTGSMGVGWGTNANQLSVQYSQGFKAPSLYQLYGPTLDGTPIGNSDLTPELNRSLESRWKIYKNIFEFDLGLFKNRLENLILYIPSIGYRNQSSFTSQGLDGELAVKSEKSTLRLGGLHQSFKNPNNTILRRPLNSVKARVNYFMTDANEFEFKFRWFGPRKDKKPSGENTKLASFEVIDLSYLHRIKNMTYGLRLLNLLNRDYEEIYGFSVMPRSLFVEAQFVF